MAAVEQGNFLTAFSHSMERDVHAFTRQVDLLWQQRCNRLQWMTHIFANMESVGNSSRWK